MEVDRACLKKIIGMVENVMGINCVTRENFVYQIIQISGTTCFAWHESDQSYPSGYYRQKIVIAYYCRFKNTPRKTSIFCAEIKTPSLNWNRFVHPMLFEIILHENRKISQFFYRNALSSCQYTTNFLLLLLLLCYDVPKNNVKTYVMYQYFFVTRYMYIIKRTIIEFTRDTRAIILTR